MASTTTTDVRVLVEAGARWTDGPAQYAVARVIDAGASEHRSGDRLLIRLTGATCSEAIDVAPGACIGLSEPVPASDAVLIPAAAKASRVWRLLELEIGEVAVCTDGPLADAVALMAGWCGASVMRLTFDGAGPRAERVGVADVEAMARLRAAVAAAPGAAAVDLSGRGEMIAALIEALPRAGRLLLTAPPSGAFTTAFYTDVHRKGIVIRGGDLDSLFADPFAWRADVRNASRLLLDPLRAAAVRACLGADSKAGAAL